MTRHVVRAITPAESVAGEVWFSYQGVRRRSKKIFIFITWRETGRRELPASNYSAGENQSLPPQAALLQSATAVKHHISCSGSCGISGAASVITNSSLPGINERGI